MPDIGLGRTIFTAALLLLSPVMWAQDAVTLYIEQVTLITPEAETDPVVNLVIRDRELDIVTQDPVPVEQLRTKP